MSNYTPGMQSTKSRLQEILQDKQPGFSNRSTAKDKGKDGEGNYGLRETKTRINQSQCAALIWILSQTQCKKIKTRQNKAKTCL